MSLPKPPAEVPVQSGTGGLAPKVQEAVERVLSRMRAEGFNPRLFETLRTAERQDFLFGFGRRYDDGRGIVTKVQSHLHGWHGYGLAVDIVENDATPWTAPQAFWNALGRHAMANGLRRDITVNGNLDLPHCQWSGAPISPTALDVALAQEQGIEAVQRKYGAL
jgi:hypothetical protein